MRFTPCALVPFALAFATPAAAQDGSRLSDREITRPLVLPALVWDYHASSDITVFGTTPTSTLAIGSLGTTVGLPHLLIPAGFEVGADPVAFGFSSVSPAVRYAPAVTLAYRPFPFSALAMQAEEPSPFELGLRLRFTNDPITIDFKLEGSIPMAIRVARVVRFDVVPTLGFTAIVDRGNFGVPVGVTFQPADVFWFGVHSGIAVPDTSTWSTLRIPLAGEVGVTIPGRFGPVVDIIAQGGFPQALQPESTASTTDWKTYQVIGMLRFYTYWDLDATTPTFPEDAKRRCKCEGK